MMSRKTQEALDRIILAKPTCEQDFNNLGLKLLLINNHGGSYRDIYLIQGTNLIVKIVKQVKTRECLSHALGEYKAYKQLKNKKYKNIHHLLPEIYYFNKEHGITVMKRYKLITGQQKLKHLLSATVDALLRLNIPSLRKENIDVRYNNLGYDKYAEHPVIIDLGYLSSFGRAEGKRFDEGYHG